MGGWGSLGGGGGVVSSSPAEARTSRAGLISSPSHLPPSDTVIEKQAPNYATSVLLPLLTLVGQNRPAPPALLQRCSFPRNQNCFRPTASGLRNPHHCLSRFSASPGRSRHRVCSVSTLWLSRSPVCSAASPTPSSYKADLKLHHHLILNGPTVWGLQILPRFSPVRIKLRYCCCGRCLDDQPCRGQSRLPMSLVPSPGPASSRAATWPAALPPRAL